MILGNRMLDQDPYPRSNPKKEWLQSVRREPQTLKGKDRERRKKGGDIGKQ